MILRYVIDSSDRISEYLITIADKAQAGRKFRDSLSHYSQVGRSSCRLPAGWMEKGDLQALPPGERSRKVRGLSSCFSLSRVTKSRNKIRPERRGRRRCYQQKNKRKRGEWKNRNSNESMKIRPSSTPE